MNKRTILQVPMSPSLKIAAEAEAKAQGFSSLQETIRVLLTKLTTGELRVHVGESAEYVKLSEAAKRRFKKAVKDIQNGKNVTKTNRLDELFSLLES